MKPEQAERLAIKEMIATEKRTLAVLDGKIASLQALLDDEESPDIQNGMKEQPYFYGVIGLDGSPGIVLDDPGVANAIKTSFSAPFVFEGTVRLEEDAPFVWTHVVATQMFEETTAHFFFESIQPTIDDFSSMIELGFVDNGSGRVLFQADRQNQVGESVAAAFFDTHREYSPAAARVSSGGMLCRPGAYAQGHGPNFAFELPAETVLPASGALTVQAKPAVYNLTNRMFVALLGYKVLGD